MYRHLLILPDGRELFSGADRLNALQSGKLTQMVNAGEDLTLGSVCGAMLDAALALDCSHVATGHYARIRRDPETGRYLLSKAEDRAKDQT